MDIDEIYTGMKTSVEESSGVLINDGGDMALRLYAVAAELFSLWTQASWLEKQSFPQSARGEFLEKHAVTRGIERRSGTPSTGEIYFEIPEAREDAVVVAEGTVCINAAGVEYLTTQKAEILPGSTYCIAPAQSRDVGFFTNTPLGSVCYMILAPVGVSSCYNQQAFSGGSDEEEDESLRQRILESFARLPNGSNAAYYEQEALNTDGVTAVKVFPRANGIGTVNVVIASEQGMPSNDLISKLQEKFDEEREICVDVQVLAPVKVSVAIDITIEVAQGYDRSTVTKAVTAAIKDMFKGELFGKNLTLAKIGNTVFSVEGVENYIINKPAADLAVAENALPVASSITVMIKR